MAGITLTVTLEDRAVRERFARLERAMGNTKPVMDAIGTGLVRSTQRRFVTQTDPDGAAWTALNPVYAATKRNARILTESGGLRDSVTHAAGRDTVRIGSNKVYAAIHQRGGTIRAKSGGRLAFRMGDALVRPTSVEIPSRPYLGINADDERMIERVIDGFLRRAIR
ncbi:phage virion morphogenesis protein [Oceaniradius stylonematis]|uniref:phage virion morphogenesis protein n=1 Tax=Oceaniradius stylonematis TaxID=2184161 RepID=UPI00273DB588|nr:phage virion morphogenesis protein [Oceaniradius stylonematis]